MSILNISPFVVKQKEQRASSNHCTYSGDEMVPECAGGIGIPRREVKLYFVVTRHMEEMFHDF